MSATSGTFELLTSTNRADGRKPFAFGPILTRGSKMESQVVGQCHNFHVFYILPATTFRTIDLEGMKKSGPLFSRFCAKESVFFERIRAHVQPVAGILPWRNLRFAELR
jgi:hypothetical protein